MYSRIHPRICYTLIYSNVCIVTQVYSRALDAKGQNIPYFDVFCCVYFLDGRVVRNTLDERCDIVIV